MQEGATEGAVGEGVVVPVGVIMVPTGTTATVQGFGISILFGIDLEGENGQSEGTLEHSFPPAPVLHFAE